MEEGTTEQRERFLAGVPEDTNRYRYSGLEDAEIKVYGEHRSSYVICTDVPQPEVDKIDSKHLGRLDYQRFLQIMVVNMPSIPHEEALSRFSNLVTLKAYRMF